MFGCLVVRKKNHFDVVCMMWMYVWFWVDIFHVCSISIKHRFSFDCFFLPGAVGAAITFFFFFSYFSFCHSITHTHTFVSHSYLFPNQEDTYWREKKRRNLLVYQKRGQIHTYYIDFSLLAHVTCCVWKQQLSILWLFYHDFYASFINRTRNQFCIFLFFFFFIEFFLIFVFIFFFMIAKMEWVEKANEWIMRI